MHNDSLFAVATDFSRHNSQKMGQSFHLPVSLGPWSKFSSYQRVVYIWMIFLFGIIFGILLLFVIWTLFNLYPISHTARSLHLISIISPNSQNISLGRSPPSSSLREEVKETCKFGRDHLSWFLSWPSWKSPRLDPEHYFGLLEKIFATNISFHPRESWCTTLNIWELWWHLGEKVYINPAAPLFPLQLRWTHRLRWGITFFMLINIALRR